MLGSAHDAEDALQETLLRAWRGLARFEGRSSPRAWLYRIATNVSPRAIERRPKRVLPVDYEPAGDPHDEPGLPLTESVWVEPYPDRELEDGRLGPGARRAARERRARVRRRAPAPSRPPARGSPAARRARIRACRDRGGARPTPASAQRASARAQGDRRAPPERSQQETLRTIDDERLRHVTERFVAAWRRTTWTRFVAMLTEDAVISMLSAAELVPRPDKIATFLAAAT